MRPVFTRAAPLMVASSRWAVAAAETSTAAPDASLNVHLPTGPSPSSTRKRILFCPVRPTESLAMTSRVIVPESTGVTVSVTVAPVFHGRQALSVDSL